ncbi:baculoviral IAP repeat-containing protein 7-A-like [Gigantopelta aegis]|uniref:baculoviral IAP repeat-containing protein 7-A-like n=1 Tax=Gigantopelta aegis TaxID=1735272 RepID=UPI001B88DA59|nr:baculoviral IAP repeat-containing protein 7-A-like [Gigantopelta aegis]XP_041379454.1 baculoviral IAP repeat-containing protein 7-A-like [Gigantopelta aegis]XP_041379457.1 baculoviral IAP repeat-containing protein 7-A-like [Gigantopelta aegis]
MRKNNRYDTYTERLESYTGWPRQYTEQTPESLATAGFFYIGSADRVTCFSCHETVRNWKPGQDPLTVHRQASPSCSFIRSLYSEKKDEEDDSLKLVAGGGDVGEVDRDSSPLHVLAVGDLDYPMKMVKSLYQGNVEGAICRDVEGIIAYMSQHSFCEKQTAVTTAKNTSSSPTPPVLTTTTTTTTQIKTSKGKLSTNKSKILKKVDGKTNGEAGRSKSFKQENDASNTKEGTENSKSQWTQSSGNTKEKQEAGSKKDLASRLKKENMTLKKQRLCKVCYKNEANVLLMPCSHIVFCSECVDSNTSCAKCEVKIIATAKVFLS